jgi:hypothetical protein
MHLNMKGVGFFYRSLDGLDYPILIVSNDWGRIEIR